MEEFGYEKLKVWQDAMTLVDAIYVATVEFPKEERFCLVPQMRKAAVSIPSNIAEGYGRGSKMFANHLRISLGSTFELRTQLEVASRQSYLCENQCARLKACAGEVSKMIAGLIKSLDA